MKRLYRYEFEFFSSSYSLTFECGALSLNRRRNNGAGASFSAVLRVDCLGGKADGANGDNVLSERNGTERTVRVRI
jgi:hypothetical protein